MKLAKIILVYNKSIKDSLTLQCFAEMNEDDNVFVLDNSTIANDNKELCFELGYNYYSMNGNIGIPKAYNFIIDKIINKFDYFSLFDDDTKIGKYYFNEVYSILDRNHDIIMPKVFSISNDKLYSPTVKKFRPFSSNSIGAINSGLVVSKRIFSSIRYDEKLFLYFADVSFFDLLPSDTDYYFLQASIFQNFSEKKTDISRTDLNQFKMRLKDAKIFMTRGRYLLYKTYFIGSLIISYRKLYLFNLIVSKDE